MRTAQPIGSSPILWFSSNLTFGGFTNPSLDDKDRIAIRNSTAISMNISPKYVDIIREQSEAQVSTSSIRYVRATATTYKIIVTTQTSLPVSVSTFTDATAFYDSLTKLLQDAVTSGQYLQTLQQVARSLNATNTASVVVFNVSSAPPSVTVAPTSIGSSSDKEELLSTSALIGIIVGGTALIAFFIAIIVYYNCYSRREPKRIGGRQKGAELAVVYRNDFAESYESVSEEIDRQFGLDRSREQVSSPNPFRFEGVNPLSPIRSPRRYFEGNQKKSEERKEKNNHPIIIVVDPGKDEVDGKDWSVANNSADEEEIHNLSEIDLFYDSDWLDGDDAEIDRLEDQSVWSKENNIGNLIDEEFGEGKEDQRERINFNPIASPPLSPLAGLIDRSDLTRSSREDSNNSVESPRYQAKKNVELGHDEADSISFVPPARRKDLHLDMNLINDDQRSMTSRTLSQGPMSVNERSKVEVMEEEDEEKDNLDEEEEEDEFFSEGVSTRKSSLNSSSKPNPTWKPPSTVREAEEVDNINTSHNKGGFVVLEPSTPSRLINWQSMNPFKAAPTKQSSKRQYIDALGKNAVKGEDFDDDDSVMRF